MKQLLKILLILVYVTASLRCSVIYPEFIGKIGKEYLSNPSFPSFKVPSNAAAATEMYFWDHYYFSVSSAPAAVLKDPLSGTIYKQFKGVKYIFNYFNI